MRAHRAFWALCLADRSAYQELVREVLPLAGHQPGQRATAWRLSGAIPPEARFAAIRCGQQIVACGLGVVQSGYVGLFDIVTDSRYRRHGHGRRLVEGLLDWARSERAHTAYLQVMIDNEPARCLYAGLGFQESYQYWYRVLRRED